MKPAVLDGPGPVPRPTPWLDAQSGLSPREAMRGLLRADRRDRARLRLAQRRQKARGARSARLVAAIGWVRGLLERGAR